MAAVVNSNFLVAIGVVIIVSHSGGCSYIVQQNDPDMICPGI
jgi:hypothetical protein